MIIHYINKIKTIYIIDFCKILFQDLRFCNLKKYYLFFILNIIILLILVNIYIIH